MSADDDRDLVDEPGRREAYWPAQLCTAFIIGCYLLLPERLTAGPSLVVPLLAGTLLVGLVATTRHRHADESPRLRPVALGLVALVSAANGFSLAQLVHLLLTGGRTSGESLIGAGAVIWLTNIAIFAIWFWELDSNGPGRRAALRERHRLDWLFVQDTTPDVAAAGWRPTFVDYVYLSFTNATAFSPTDTMPLTPLAKLLMLAQSLASLLTIGLVVARAVNILG